MGGVLLAIAQPDLFGHVDRASAAMLAGARRRRQRTRVRSAAVALLAEPWSIDDAAAEPAAVALARRFLRRYPDRDRANPSPPLLSDREQAAEWHAEEEIAEDLHRRDAW